VIVTVAVAFLLAAMNTPLAPNRRYQCFLKRNQSYFKMTWLGGFSTMAIVRSASKVSRARYT